jgi:hypothetical protein
VDSGSTNSQWQVATLLFRGTWRRSPVQSSPASAESDGRRSIISGEIHLSHTLLQSCGSCSGVLRTPLAPLCSARQSPKSLKLAQRSRRRKTPTVETTSKSSHTARGRNTASCCVEERRVSDFYMLADIIAILAIRARRCHDRGQLASKNAPSQFQ